MARKFKSGDLVENIHTGEIDMVENVLPYQLEFVMMPNRFLPTMLYKKINPKEVKFNIKNNNKPK